MKQVDYLNINGEKYEIISPTLKEALDTKLTQPYVNNYEEACISDSAEGMIKNIEVKGRSTQYQTKGYNLFDIDNTTDGYVDFNSGVIITDPNLLNYNEKVSDYILLKEDETYLCFYCCATITDNYIWVGIGFYDENKEFINRWTSMGTTSTGILTMSSKSAIPENARYMRISFRKYDDGILQIEYGETVHDYEPYTGAVPSPNPDYPQEIKSIDTLDIKVCGKNLIPIVEDMTSTINGIKFEYSNGIYNISGVSTGNGGRTNPIFSRNKFKLYPGEYIFSMEVVKGDAKNVSPILSDKDHVPLYGIINNTLHIEEPIEIYPGINVISETEYDCTIRLQIEAGTEATSWEPYKEQIVSITLPFSFKSSLDGTVYDYIDVDRGKYVQCLKEITFDGSESWGESPIEKLENTTRFQLKSDTFYDLKNTELQIYSNMFKWLKGDIPNEEYVRYAVNITGDSYLWIYILKNRLYDNDGSYLTSFKEFLNNNNVKVTHQLSEPIEYDIPQEDLDKLKSLKTYYNITNILTPPHSKSRLITNLICKRGITR